MCGRCRLCSLAPATRRLGAFVPPGPQPPSRCLRSSTPTIGGSWRISAGASYAPRPASDWQPGASTHPRKEDGCAACATSRRAGATEVSARPQNRWHSCHSVTNMTTHDRPFGRYFEDFEVGDVYKHWPGKTITEYDDHLFCMITMNHHPLHTNAWFAEHETVQGKNVVVGNLVYSLVLGMSVPDVSGSCIANLEVESLTHRKPTFHGDTIYAETRVLDKVESTSKPDRGVVTVESKGFNQRGEEVCYFRRKLMVWKKDSAPARQRPYTEADAWGE